MLPTLLLQFCSATFIGGHSPGRRQQAMVGSGSHSEKQQLSSQGSSRGPAICSNSQGLLSQVPTGAGPWLEKPSPATWCDFSSVPSSLCTPRYPETAVNHPNDSSLSPGQGLEEGNCPMCS